MNRSLGALVALAVSTALILGSAGFTTVEGHRPIDVSVVDDEDAYLALAEVPTLATPGGERALPADGAGDVGFAAWRYDRQNTVAVSGAGTTTTATLLRVTNRFGTDLTTVEAHVVDDADLTMTVNETASVSDLRVGEAGDVKVDVSCGAGPRLDRAVAVTVAVSGDGVEAKRLQKTVYVSCLGSESDAAAALRSDERSTPDGARSTPGA